MIDASIPLGVRPPQIDSPMNALAKVLQVREAQQGQQMNALKMEQDQRNIESQNRLRQLLGGFGADHSVNQQKLLQGGFMKESQDYGKNQADIDKTGVETQYKKIETAHKKIDMMGQVFGYVKDNPSAESAMQATDYLVQYELMTPEQAQATKAKIAADPSPETIRALATQAFQSALSTKDQLPKLQTFNAGDRQVNQAVNPITGRATETGSTVIGRSADNVASVAQSDLNSRRADQRARDRLTLDQGNQVAEAGGPSQAAFTKQFGKPSAGYRWKADGSQEFIPGGPADQKAQMKTSGEGTVDSVVADLRDKYNQLNEGGGVVNSDSGALSNIGASIGASGIGQTFGGAVGTKNQSSRDAVIMTRPLLLQAIMKATGMSAKQMDSNAELKLYLATATDPQKGFQANMEALDRIESLYGGGKKATPAKPAGRPAKNAKGWVLKVDANGNQAYVSPDGKQFEEVK